MELSLMVGYYRTVLGFIICCLQGIAYGFPTPVDFDGALLRWNINLDSEPIYYELTADDPGDVVFFRPAVEESVILWNDVPTSYFRYRESDGSQKPQVTINFQQATDDGYSAGYAIFDESDGNGPVHCSITVGTSGSYEAISKTILHELGHCFGLGHSLIPQAIMSYKLEENSYALDIDDEAAITRLYPADGSTPKVPPGCSIGVVKQGFAWVWFLLIPLFFAFGTWVRETLVRKPVTSLRRCPPDQSL